MKKSTFFALRWSISQARSHIVTNEICKIFCRNREYIGIVDGVYI